MKNAPQDHGDDAAIAMKVYRYERALGLVLERRPTDQRTAAITDDEHRLAVQIAENVAAYELGLRERHVPEKVVPERAVTPGREAPAPEEAPGGSGSRRRGARRSTRRKARPEGRPARPARGAGKEPRG